MPCLNEAEIAYNIKKRNKNDNIFTYIGPTLIVINPYKYIEKLFSQNVITSIENSLK